MSMVADLSDLEKAVADSEKNVAALMARANELAEKKPLQGSDPLDNNDPVTNELGINQAPPSPPSPKKKDDGMNVMLPIALLLGAFIIYKILK